MLPPERVIRFLIVWEGTNGSVHIQFSPIGDEIVAFSNHEVCGGNFGLGDCRKVSKDSL